MNRKMKVSATFSAKLDLINKVDAYAQSQNMTRSLVVCEALEEYLAKENPVLPLKEGDK